MTNGALLTSVERPIVIVNGGARRARWPPTWRRATRRSACCCPYTPLHHLLLADAGWPLVMTSGNLSDEPNRVSGTTRRSLGSAPSPTCSCMHDRDIDTRCDDSVARVIAGRPVVFRRSRGLRARAACRALGASHGPVLACGALLKNTFCLGVGDAAYLGPHIGDLENLETFESFEHAVDRMERFLGVRPAVVAHDLHPEYLSTALRAATARRRSRSRVQHHHAHVASAMAEHGLERPGAGRGVRRHGIRDRRHGLGRRDPLADVRPLRAARARSARSRSPVVTSPSARSGGRRWRCSLTRSTATPPLDGCPLFAAVPSADLAVVRQMLAGGVNTSLARGVGRYFDAAGRWASAGRARATRVRSRWSGISWPIRPRPRRIRSRFATSDGLLTMDLRPAVRALADDVRAGARRRPSRRGSTTRWPG